MEYTNQISLALGWPQQTNYRALQHHITGKFLAVTYADLWYLRQCTALRLVPAFDHNNRPKSFS